MTTKSQDTAADVLALLKARNPLIWITSREEARVERHLAAICEAAKIATATWDCAAGIVEPDKEPNPETRDIGTALGEIELRTKSGPRGAWIMRDVPPWLTGGAGMTTLRQLRNLVRLLPTVELENAQTLIVLSPAGEVPAELMNQASVIEWPLPDREEMGQLLDNTMDAQDPSKVEKLNGNREPAIEAALGLSEDEAAACYARSIIQRKRMDPAIVIAEKKRIITRERLLEWYDPLPGGLDSIGGLDALKGWLKQRAMAFSPEARDYGLPSPKGMFLVGPPGTGKSMTAKAAATSLRCPLIKMDLGALKSKFVGESEGNIRRALKVLEALGLCVLWIDEIEKGMQGATSGSSDGGTSADQLGVILTWMQERKSPVFVVATANDATSLPPEFLRKGRFDEVWFVDLPTPTEREAVLAATLKTYGRGSVEIALDTVAKATDGWTGAEIAALIPEAMFAAFADGAREIETRDLIEAAGQTKPLSVTAAGKINALREWAKGKTRPASLIETKTAERKIRALDI